MAMGALRRERRRSIEESQRVNQAANSLSRRDYACRAALYRRVGKAWLCMARYDTIGQAIEESRPGDVVWWFHRGTKWVPLIRCVQSD